MEQKQLIINGRFLTEQLTGVQRTAWEIVKVLSKNKQLKIILAMPCNGIVPNDAPSNISYVKVGKHKNNIWEQFSLPKFCKKVKAPLLNMCCLAPAFYSSYVVLHDIRGIERKEFDNSLFRFKFKSLVGAYIYRSKQIFTVSEFAKNSIIKQYPKLKKEPIVIYNGYEHILKVPLIPVNDIFGEFYLSVGSVLKHKNFKYILKLAQNNPTKRFVIVGKYDEEFLEQLGFQQNLENVIFSGYLETGQLLWLYSKCVGFVLPSLYEGFGIPPLEALAVGCKKIFLSDIPVFKEIYGEVANFFDPLDYEHTVNLDEGKEVTVETANLLLHKYTWQNSANIMLNSIDL